MDGETFGRLTYLVLLGGVIAFWLLVQNRRRLGAMLQQALVWGLIFVGIVAAYGLWGDIRRDVMPHRAAQVEPGLITLPRARDGHYYLTLEINDAPVRFMIDTGASDLVLAARDAERVGLRPADLIFTGRARTANGDVRTAPVRLDRVEIGPRLDRDVRAFVTEGALDISLLGMGYLQRFARIEIERDKMTLSW